MLKKIYKLNNSHFWKFLDSRNLTFNRKKMINSKKINLIDHTIWWFNNTREIYFYKIDNYKIIYFWQQLIKINKKKFFIGGWHSNSNKINLFHVIYVLKWQLSDNKKKNRNFNWIAVVKKNNEWVLKLTTYLGYKKINKFHKDYQTIKNCFNVNDKDFYFLLQKN